MRLIVALLVFTSALLALPSNGSAQENTGVDFVRIWPSWREAESFVRISEYFGGKENTGRQTMLRTHPDERAGFYFLTRTRNKSAELTGAKFILELITPDSPYPKIFTFPTPVKAGQHVFNLGLTGRDWVGQAVQPIAWRLRLLSAEDRELATAQSFLWNLPETE